MNNFQAMVAEFHRKFCQPIGVAPRFSRPELRAALIHEEATEVIEALTRRDMPEVVDGLCDLLYVVFGCAVEMGIDLESFFTEVHYTNMAKEGGPTRADGKILKPPGWRPPRIAEMLAKLTGEPIA